MLLPLVDAAFAKGAFLGNLSEGNNGFFFSRKRKKETVQKNGNAGKKSVNNCRLFPVQIGLCISSWHFLYVLLSFLKKIILTLFFRPAAIRENQALKVQFIDSTPRPLSLVRRDGPDDIFVLRLLFRWKPGNFRFRFFSRSSDSYSLSLGQK